MNRPRPARDSPPMTHRADDHHDHPTHPEGLPTDLSRDLRSAFAAREVSARVDRAVLDAAAQAGQRRPAWRRLALLGSGLAAAAAIALAVYLGGPGRGKPTGPIAAEDFNADGRIDIVDALALARAQRDGATSTPDLTGDGTSDQADIDALAMRIVAVGDGSGGRG